MNIIEFHPRSFSETFFEKVSYTSLHTFAAEAREKYRKYIQIYVVVYDSPPLKSIGTNRCQTGTYWKPLWSYSIFPTLNLNLVLIFHFHIEEKKSFIYIGYCDVSTVYAKTMQRVLTSQTYWLLESLSVFKSLLCHITAASSVPNVLMNIQSAIRGVCQHKGSTHSVLQSLYHPYVTWRPVTRALSPLLFISSSSLYGFSSQPSNHSLMEQKWSCHSTRIKAFVYSAY